jgi:hypothetical protein
VGPLRTDAGRRFLALACRDADALVVRDEASAEELRACGVRTPVSIGADAACLLEASPADQEIAARKLARAGAGDAPFAAFALRAWSFAGSEEQIVAESAMAAAALPSGWKAIFLPFHRGGGTDDSQIARRAAAACGERGAVVEADTATEMIALLARARAIVAMRLHALILGAMSGTPSVALAYDPKVASAARRLGLERFTLPLGDAARLPATLAEVLGEEESLRARLTMAARSSRLDASASFELIEPASEEISARPPATPVDLPRALGHLAEVAAATHRQSAAHHRRLRVLARQDASREILAIEADYPVSEEAAQREVAQGLAEAAERTRTERERWLAELMRVRAAAWDAVSKAEYRTKEVELRENDARAAAAAARADAAATRRRSRPG